MSSLSFSSLCALALAAVSGGCVVMSESPLQQLEVHAVLGHREVAGVGCVLSNGAGRWFVVAPGRISVERSRDPLTVDCARDGAGNAREQVAPRAPSRFDTDKLIGNLIVKAGLGNYLDHHSGKGFAYPETLTVILHAPQAAAQAEQGEAGGGNVMF
ncbi:hypothetical protein HH212_00680 [Massilia forsythiae]|uniref:Uncharacterized protein n=1 Tax=Massilia forsythiae TaxID=2728020 RepID=A0A7Z2VT66_9BURK|nr:hypothetical protein [Massilia forsythiae]QJD98738.1 hypothetical protein HH212_00680 [Massilia forsythiae]